MAVNYLDSWLRILFPHFCCCISAPSSSPVTLGNHASRQIAVWELPGPYLPVGEQDRGMVSASWSHNPFSLDAQTGARYFGWLFGNSFRRLTMAALSGVKLARSLAMHIRHGQPLWEPIKAAVPTVLRYRRFVPPSEDHHGYWASWHQDGIRYFGPSSPITIITLAV